MFGNVNSNWKMPLMMAGTIFVFGFVAVLIDNAANAEMEVHSQLSPSGAAATASNVTASHIGDPAMRRTVLTLAATPVVVAPGGTGTNGYGGTKIWDFPEGRVLLHGCVMDLNVTVDAANLDAADSGDVSVGSAVVTDGDLTDATDIDFCAAVNLDPITNAAHSALASAAQFDGTATAKDMYLNMNISSNDISTTSTNTVSGTVTFTWSFLGDY